MHLGLFDSGIGGLSVLAAVRRRLPQAACTYIADSRHTPWGDRPAAWVQARCGQLATQLINTGAQLVLVACNTGTTQAISALRAHWPGLPFVGVEPGIKPAVAASRSGRVAVMATQGTLQSPRLDQLVQHHAGQASVLRLPCPGLAEAIEQAGIGDGTLPRLLDQLAEQLRAAEVDTVVLGCTHYPLVADQLQQRLGPGVALIDTADAVARRVASLVQDLVQDLVPADTPRAQAMALSTAGPRPEAGGPADQTADSSPAPSGHQYQHQHLHLLATARPDALAAAARRWVDADATARLLDLPDPMA